MSSRWANTKKRLRSADETIPLEEPSANPSNLEQGLQHNARTGGSYMTQAERNTAMTAGTVCTFLGLAVVIGLLVGIIVMVAHINDRGIAYEGEQCRRFGLIDNMGHYNADGQCVGDSRGQCDAWFETEPEDCRPLTFGWTVDFYNLPNFTLCWNNLCVYALAPGPSHDWICPGAGANASRYEFKEVGQKHCLDYLAHDEDLPALTAMATCVDEDPLCVYTYRDAKYTILHPEEPPFVLGADDEPTGVTPVADDFVQQLADSYHAAKAEIEAALVEQLGTNAENATTVEEPVADADA